MGVNEPFRDSPQHEAARRALRELTSAAIEALDYGVSAIDELDFSVVARAAARSRRTTQVSRLIAGEIARNEVRALVGLDQHRVRAVLGGRPLGELNSLWQVAIEEQARDASSEFDAVVTAIGEAQSAAVLEDLREGDRARRDQVVDAVARLAALSPGERQTELERLPVVGDDPFAVSLHALLEHAQLGFIYGPRWADRGIDAHAVREVAEM